MSIRNCILVCTLLLGSTLILCQPANAATDENTTNSCVQCHSQLPVSSFMGVRSHSWSGSVHQKHGVTCDKCHGGNPDIKDKQEAHAGVLGSSDPKSTVYFKNVPATCGKCHDTEFSNFKRSRHFKMLETEGKGPSCVTCHGSMVTRVLGPDNMVDVCEQCHNNRIGVLPYVPQKAKAVLLLLRESEALLDATAKLHQPAEGAAEDQHITDARASLRFARLSWHKFDLDEITDYLQGMYSSLEMLPKP